MPTNTSNLNLTVYDLSEINERFVDFRNNLAGNSNSNMTKIDTAVGSKQPKIYTGTSATAAATAAKTVTINGGSYTPVAGDILAIKFTSGNTAASATLAVNTDSARAIQLNGVALSTEFGTIAANGTLMLYFDGTNYQMFGSQKTSASVSWTDVTSKPSPTITLGGDLTGSVTLTNVGNGTLTATVVDDSHNHTISTVTGLQLALDGKQASLGFVPENQAKKGTANGYAELDATGKVPAAQLPSFVDDVLEYANLASFPATGEAGKIYVDIATNTTYRWSGTVYVAIGSSLALGETSTTAYRGDRGKIAYDHSQVAHAPSNANYYVHPANHPPSIITQDASNRFVTDTEKTTWNNKEFFQTENTVRNNLGTPTVREMALFHGQFNNKFRFIPAYMQEESTDGTTWVASTRLSASALKDLMIGEGQGTSVNAIPAMTIGGNGYYRLTWDNSQTGYVFLNHLYCYCSTNGNTVNFLIEAKHNTSGWQTVASGATNNWPGHVSIPHTSIPFSSNASQFGQIRLTLSVASASNTNPITLYGIEWFGGYPSGRRNAEYYDGDKNVTFPAGIRGTQLTSTVANGTAPLVVTSTSVVTNLNADLLDGQHGSYYAPIASPAFTGIPTAATAAVGTNTTQLATTAFVNAEIANDAAPIAHVGATGTAHGVATTSVNGFMSSSDKTKLDGIATSANNYVHPTTDGNLHVPATSTTNNGKALIAGATAGSFAWTTLTASMVGLGNVTNESKATMFTSPTFTGNLPVLPASNPTTDNQAVRKAYVDLATDLVRPNYTVEYRTANSRFEIGTYDAGWTTFTALATVPVVGNKIAIYLDPQSQTEGMFPDQTSIYAADGTSFVIAVPEPNNDYGFDIYGPIILNLEFKMGAQVGNFFYNKLTGYITSSLTSKISPKSVIGGVNGFPNLDLSSNLEWINTSFAKLASPVFSGNVTIGSGTVSGTPRQLNITNSGTGDTGIRLEGTAAGNPDWEMVNNGGEFVIYRSPDTGVFHEALRINGNRVTNFTFAPTFPTLAPGTNDTQGATTAFVRAAVSSLPSFLSRGSGIFNSTTGRVITHNLGHTNYLVNITPTSAASGFLGEYYVTKAANTITVFNTGSNITSTFDYMIIPS